MTDDLERLISDSLKAVGDAYSPEDARAAREEFMRRRRRRRITFGTGAIALAGAAAAVALFLAAPEDVVRQQEAPPVAQPSVHELIDEAPAEVVSATTVGDAPSGLAVGGSGVWVANSGDGTVSRLDAQGDIVETFEVPGEPDDLVVSAADAQGRVAFVVVADSHSSSLTLIEPQESEEEATQVLTGVDIPEGSHLDIAVGSETVWVSPSGSDGLVRFIGNLGETFDVGATLEVAIEDGVVWALRANGDVISIEPEDVAVPDPKTVGTLELTSANSDLAAGEGYLWVADGGTILRVDQRTAEVIGDVVVGGTYAGIAIGNGLIWVVSGGPEEEGTLSVIDPDTLRVLATYPLEGRPFDVAVDEESVWITHNSTDEVTRFFIVEDFATGE